MASINLKFETAKSTSACEGLLQNDQSTNSNIQKDECAMEPKKCRYKSGVLVGNWFNRRATFECPKNDWLTVNATTYNCKTNPAFKKDKITFGNNKLKAEGLGAEFLIKHSRGAINNNYITTNDLTFRILSQGLCGPQVRKYSGRKNQWLPEIHHAKNFVNVNIKKPGLNNTYPIKRFFKPQGEINKPYLRHLDIDPNLPFQPHLVKAENISF